MLLDNLFESEPLDMALKLGKYGTLGAFGLYTEFPLSREALANVLLWGAATCILQAGVQVKTPASD